MPYKKPTNWKNSDGRVLTGFGQELELLTAANVNFIKYAKCFSRAYLENGDTFEISIQINGGASEVIATGEAVCRVDEVQSLYIKARIENPCESAPIEPALEPEIL